MVAIDWQPLAPLRQEVLPLHVLWHALGYTPLLSCRHHKHRKILNFISWMWIIQTLIWFIIFMSYFFWSDDGYNNGIQQGVYFISTCTSVLSGVVTWIGNITSRFDKSIKLQNLLAQSDMLFRNPQGHVEKTKLVALIMFTITSILHLFGFVLPLFYASTFQLKLLPFFMCSVVSNLDTLQYCVLLWDLRQRLSALNARISETNEPAKRLSIFHLEETKQNHVTSDLKLRQLRRTRQTIVEVAAIADEYFGSSQLTGIAKSLSGIILTSHDILVSKTWSTIKVVTFLTWVTADFLRIAVLCLACSYVTAEYRRTGNILVSTLLNKAPGARSLEENDFLAQVFIWNPRISFTAAGFFKIDTNFLLSVFGVTATYLVIIAQVVLK